MVLVTDPIAVLDVLASTTTTSAEFLELLVLAVEERKEPNTTHATRETTRL
jgi:hypothetical protein